MGKVVSVIRTLETFLFRSSGPTNGRGAKGQTVGVTGTGVKAPDWPFANGDCACVSN